MNIPQSTRRSWFACGLALLALAALRLLWLPAYPINSDEAQHAHVAWAWTRGLLPYRDVFDNHGPLFGLIHSLVLRLTGERADVMTWLRLSMQPWYALALASVWWIGRRLYGGRVAFAAVLITGLFPRFFLISGQFRTDDMWAAAWLASLAMVVGAPWRPWRWLLSGLLAGVALSVSQKTLLLLLTSLLAWLVVILVRPPPGSLGRRRCVLIGLVGLLLPPLLCLGWFYLHGDLAAAWYGLAGYNMTPSDAGADSGGQVTGTVFMKLPWMFLLLIGGTWLTVSWLRRDRQSAVAPAAFLLLQGGFFLLLIWFVWPLVTRQDFLPVIPPLLLVICGVIAQQPWVRLGRRELTGLAALAIAIELVALFVMRPPWRDELARQRAQLAAVLRYTDRDDTVMDAKGDAIFRMRPYYPVIESLAMRRLRSGLILDTIAAEMVRHRTMAVIRLRLPPASDAFVQLNYLGGDENLWIAGQTLPPSAAPRTVHLALPGRYVLVDGDKPVQASLDGAAPASEWDLSRGDHQFSTAATGKLYLVWSQAWDRGWRPQTRSVPLRRLAALEAE